MYNLLGFKCLATQVFNHQYSAFLFAGIGEADWALKTIFEVSERELSAPNIDLVFDGLDTFSVVSFVSTVTGEGSDRVPIRKQPF